jgi:putative ABC transport system permease protein
MPVEPRLDVRVLGFAAVLAAGSSIIFAVEPIRRFSTTDLQRLLVRSSGVLTMGLRERRSRNALVGAQVSLSVLLLGTAGIIGYRYQAFVERDMGYDDTSVMTAVPDYEAVGIDEYRQPELGMALLDRLDRRPEVAAGALSRFIVQSYPPQPHHAAELEEGLGGPSAAPVNYLEVTPTFFDVMDIAVVRGRGFDPSDDMRSDPVAIVTEGAAGRWWPEGPLLGRRLRFGADGAWVTVIGVAADIGSLDYLGRFWGASGYSPPAVFRPMAQADQRSEGWNDGRGCVGRCGGVTIAAHGPGDPAQVAVAIREELHSSSPTYPCARLARCWTVRSAPSAGTRCA